VASLFDQVFYSHEIGDRKPNLASFRKVLKLAGIRASETLFIDDNEANVAGATAAGLRALPYTPGEDLAALCP
jgi:putative hydrolase of the HAD superfamily